MALRVAINGLGRIGRAFLKVGIKREEIEIVAVNDLGDMDNMAYLLKYDSAYGKSGLDVHAEKNEDGSGALVINGKRIAVLQQKDPAQLPWRDLNIDVVVESTGFFESYDKAKLHLDAGAKKVVISAPAKGEPVEGITGATVLMGINDDKLQGCQISSNASCTTNASAPLIQILHEAIGIEKASLSTVHGYTGTQKLVDSPDAKDWRRGRAAAQNIVPSTTGAAIAVTLAIPDLKGKFDGIAIRVPVITGSIADITFIAKRDTTVEEVNAILKAAAQDERWKKVFTVTEEELVSSDIVGSPYASIADLTLTNVVGGNLVKVLAWYDNEMGYTHALVEHVIKTGSVG
ncbi:MAG: type I glyceraldehyde-3-phosphate dehydrogenase [Candidatus Yonathbacteria bacterium RIFOXYC1_FULL_52_10]|uniref:Type I glyceraldehyde-3-phosphate dehydrogenase n=1 Tax=Candidatus Yonathbacteria bacterium RIFOXYD1_FULL_52_36 TaxID=1802730 RepID=A0A1G2SMY3_9BACT|nr:MAG: type I glyceraldehyde-3-phosphate dehydrogenase [Candidatus Yonathbacteria bacterium RIFOXYC1_FULL_52_10]OHA85999.1 MAG: type I glyceraldehyde-3-phosphate dehydrogenase [Candidatus Yonathbacteria bacterium RIFOXYD1_FULL_52_36]